MRKRANASFGKKVQRNANHLMHALGAMFTSHAAEVVGGPVSDVLAVMKPKHDHPDSQFRADVLELFAGQARITEAFTKRRGAALMPRDLIYGHDLRSPAVQEEVLDEILRERPWLVWAAPPCTAWCAFSRLNFSPQERRRRQQKEVVYPEDGL